MCSLVEKYFFSQNVYITIVFYATQHCGQLWEKSNQEIEPHFSGYSRPLYGNSWHGSIHCTKGVKIVAIDSY